MRSLIFPKRWSRLPLALEITLILVIKLALLCVLWKLFFSEPQTKKMRMPTNLVEQHFLTDTALLPSSPISEAPHDTH